MNSLCDVSGEDLHHVADWIIWWSLQGWPELLNWSWWVDEQQVRPGASALDQSQTVKQRGGRGNRRDEPDKSFPSRELFSKRRYGTEVGPQIFAHVLQECLVSRLSSVLSFCVFLPQDCNNIQGLVGNNPLWNCSARSCRASPAVTWEGGAWCHTGRSWPPSPRSCGGDLSSAGSSGGLGGTRSAFPFCVRKIKIIIEDDVGTKQFCDLAYKWKLD